MATSSNSVWAFYYLQGEDGEDRSHPNAYKIPLPPSGNATDVTLADVHRHFPLKDPKAFHFRFRINTSIKTPNGPKSTFYWLDITSSTQKVPLVSGRVICKLLRLVRPTQTGLVFKRKPVLISSNNSESGSRTGSDGVRKGGSMSTPQQSISRQASTVPEKGRPAKYSDTPPSSATPPSERTSSSISSAEDRTGSSSGLKQTPSTPSSASTPPPAPQESFEDFLSGGQSSSASSAKKEDVNLMSDTTWNTNGNTTKRSAASEFLNAMDPLAQQNSSGHSPAPTSAPVRKDPPKFEDDGGQTVGPVTMSEMKKYAVSSDGSNVYNASLVDKSTKPEHVRRAMEERERQLQADVQKARDELRQREDNKVQMNAMKENANAILGPKLKAWAEDNGRVKNIRTLLSTMHQVMWEDSKWQECNMGKLIQPNDIKKNYRKAMIVVHPDKSGGRNAEQLLIAERVFAALNTAWDEFMKTNPC